LIIARKIAERIDGNLIALGVHAVYHLRRLLTNVGEQGAIAAHLELQATHLKNL
jgi:hypothetical protein